MILGITASGARFSFLLPLLILLVALLLGCIRHQLFKHPFWKFFIGITFRLRPISEKEFRRRGHPNARGNTFLKIVPIMIKA